MRNLATKDIFKISRIIKVAGCREDIKGIIEKFDGKDPEALGKALFDILMAITESEEAEKLIYKLLAEIMEKSEQEIESQSLKATINDLKAIAKNNNIIDFFKQADISE